IRRSFVVYLASHNRPIHEVLAPTLRDISGEFEATFRGMTAEPVELKALLSARDRMISDLQAGLDADERAFLLSLARNEPIWACSVSSTLSSCLESAGNWRTPTGSRGSIRRSSGHKPRNSQPCSKPRFHRGNFISQRNHPLAIVSFGNMMFVHDVFPFFKGSAQLFWRDDLAKQDDAQAMWLPVIGKALAYLCLQDAQAREPEKFDSVLKR